MADYTKLLFSLLVGVFVLLHCCRASEDTDDDDDDEVCGFPGEPAYGFIKPRQNVYEVDSVVVYTCRVGYILLGAPVRRCTQDGSWTEGIPICDDSMTTLGTAFSTSAVPGHPAEYAIDRNRDTCAKLKPEKPTWWRIDLGGSYKILSVAITMVSTNKFVKFTLYVIEISGQGASYKRCATFSGRFGTQTIVLACAEGKGLEGQKVHIEDHLHKDRFELCEVEVQVEKATGYDCGRPDWRPFSMIFEPEDDEVQYRCETGYELVGDSTRECLPSGQWSGEAPACEPIVCQSLKDLENGELSFSVEEGDSVGLEGTTAVYKCNHGYKLDGDSARLCLKDGSWSGLEPECKVIRCPVPEGKHAGETYRLLNRTNRVGSMAQLRCRRGGVLSGDDPYITCTVDETWTNPKAECIQPGGSSMHMKEKPEIVNEGGIIFGMVVAGLMMVIILASFYIVKRRREANKPQLPSRKVEAPAPPPRPPPREKGLKSAIMDFVNRDSAGHKYEALNLEEAEGKDAWKSRSLPLEPNQEAAESGAPRRTLSYNEPEKLGTGQQTGPEESKGGRRSAASPVIAEINEDQFRKDTPGGDRVATPGSADYAAVDYDRKRQSRLLKQQESEERSQGTASPEGRELPPIPKEDDEGKSTVGTRADEVPSPSGKDTEEAASEASEDVSLPIAPSETSDAPTPSPDIVIENQVDGASVSPSTPPDAPSGRRRRRMMEQPSPEQPSSEEPAEPRRTRTRRRGEPETPPSPPPPEPEPEEEPEERPTRRARQTPEERPTRRTRQWETPSTTTQPSQRRRY